MPTTVTDGDTRTIVVSTDRTVVVGSSAAGPQGVPGLPGLPGSSGSGPESLTLTYDGNDVLQTVDAETYFLNLAYDIDGRLTTVTDTVSGQIRALSYDIAGKLVSVTVTA